MPNTNGTIRLFQIAGIQVFLHWSWFLVAIYEIERRQRYSSIGWSILEYVALFAIVTMHEFGHALACRHVGGRAFQIVLWPLGGVAYVNAPPRPGATLWSIAAGPLVHVALMPLLGFILIGASATPGVAGSDFGVFVRELNILNLALFVFNVLPVYPLDGGKILRSLLWYVVGRARSLMGAVIVGFIGVAGLALLALGIHSTWLVVMAVFAGIQCFNGYKQAQALKRLEDAPRREGFACPSCKAHPPRGRYWVCASCRTPFDTFETLATCPNCNTRFAKTMCLDCTTSNAYADWVAASPSLGAQAGPSPRSLSAPSIVPVVAGVIACAFALVLLPIALLFFKVSSDEIGRQPRLRAEIERLWDSEGMSIPGEQMLVLQPGVRYDAYVERPGGATLDEIDVSIVDAESGRPVAVAHPAKTDHFRNHGRTMSSMASFSIRESGRYVVRASSHFNKSGEARIKIGPSATVVNGNTATIERALGIGVAVLALVQFAAALLLFRYYARRRKQFSLMMRGLASSEDALRQFHV